MRKITGHCLCHSVEYSIADSLLYSGFCHCSECRRWTGSAFSATCGVKVDDFQLMKGKELLRSYKKGEHSNSHFCSKCSSIVFGDVPAHNMTFVFLGTLDEAPSLKPQWHIYTGSKADWYEINDDLPQF
ncbi:MAG: hypothetical protein ACI93R_002086 [Flavobacteriales bacterium]|jgi:hypothetical protein